MTDPFDALAELTPLRAIAGNGNWAATEAFFAQLGSADEVSFAVGALAGIDGTEEYLEKAVQDRPGDPLARTLLAERYTRVGWAIRSGARAKNVSREQFEQFHAWLRKSEQILIEVCAEHPGYAPAWTARLTTARGLELGQSEARRRYDRLAAHHPHDVRAQLQLLQQVCPKWGGSWEDAHGFAGECLNSAPAGSYAGMVVAEAHVEHWLDLSDVAEKEYLRDVAVRNDLRQAARSSVLHPDHRPGWRGIMAHSTFAFAFSLGGHLKDAAPHFAALGDKGSESPWYYLPKWRTRFAEYRTAALDTL
ncbi:hypothetical protein [Streptomyces sp. NPDC047000]|uniref:hypothetical protein n=1 Tax=Streptomyces sp. NPDC047000 TaxID=3155474 RepID=UPI00340B6391